MRFKLLISAVLAMIVVGAALAFRSNSKIQQRTEQRTVKVVVNQLPARENRIPVEIIQAIATSSAPNVLDDVTYALKNNSGKAISAVAVIKKIFYRDNGRLVGLSLYSTVDFAFHPDIAGSKPFASKPEVPMEAAGPMSFEDGVVIEGVKLTIEYIEYVGASSYGVGSEGEHRIMSQREGAKKYKDLLRQNYSQAGRSLVTVVPLLEETPNPEQLKLTEDEILGADRYRRYLLKTFRTKGAAEVERYIKLKE
jgi:hypothetical protein